MAARRMRHCGLKLRQIGERLNVGAERARQMVCKAERLAQRPSGNLSPIERYLAMSPTYGLSKDEARELSAALGSIRVTRTSFDIRAHASVADFGS